MASKITTKNSLNAKGTLNLSDNNIVLEVEDVDTPVALIDLLKDFDGKEVTISVNHSNDLV